MNLKDLQSARTHIETLKETAGKVIEGIDGLRHRYETHLPELLQNINAHNEKQTLQLITDTHAVVDEAVEKLRKVAVEISEHNRQQHEKINAYLGTYESALETIRLLETEIAGVNFPQRLDGIDRTVTNIHEAVRAAIGALNEVKTSHEQYLQASRTEYTNLLEQLTQTSHRQSDEVMENINKSVRESVAGMQQVSNDMNIALGRQRDEITQHLDHSAQQLGGAVTAIRQGIDATTNKLNVAIEAMSAAFQKQEGEITYYLKAYQSLVSYARAVEEKVDALDFPAKVQALENKIDQLEDKVEQIGQATQQVNRQAEESRRTLREELDGKHAALEERISTLMRKELREQLQQSSTQLESTELRIRNNAEGMYERLQKKVIENLVTTNDSLQAKIEKQSKQMQTVMIVSIVTAVVAILAMVVAVIK